MTAFATVEDLATFLRQDLDAAGTATASQDLDGASELIRGYLGQQVDAVTDDEVTLYGMGSNLLQLPEAPVTAVSEVQAYGDVVDPTGYTFTSGGLLFRVGATWPGWGNYDPTYGYTVNNVVQVTYDHGYDPVPDDIKWVCLDIVGRRFVNPSSTQSETIGNYSYTLGSGNQGLGLSDLNKEVLDRYRLIRVA